MAETRRVDVRVPVALATWVDGYAVQCGASRSAVVCWALREAMTLAAGGVRDLTPPPVGSRDGRSVAVGRVRGAGTRASSSPGAPVVSRPAAGAPASDSGSSDEAEKSEPREQERPLDEPEPDELGGIPPSQPSPDEPAPAQRPRPQRSREDAVRAQWLRERYAKLGREKGMR